MAAVIKVGLGEKIKGLAFALPEEFKVRTVEGQVMWKDGKPAAGVDVMLLCPQSAKPDGFAVEFSPTWARTDEQGQFRLEGFTSETYWLEARGSQRDGKKDEFVEVHSPSKKIVLSEDLKNTKLVLSENEFSQGCKK